MMMMMMMMMKFNFGWGPPQTPLEELTALPIATPNWWGGAALHCIFLKNPHTHPLLERSTE